MDLMLLYLGSEDTPRLIRCLDMLEEYLISNRQYDIDLENVRGDLYELTLGLSPLSRTRKALRTLLEMIDGNTPGDRTEIVAAMDTLRQIYQPGKSLPVLRNI